MDFNQVTFKYSWRPYQERVLNAVEKHLDDNKLHIVAAPGAGKTTLGIEVFKRLAKNTLILSPTRVIRDQWIDRLRDFIDCENPHQLSWTSNDLHSPGVFTSITYQALHARMKDTDSSVEESEEDTASLNNQEIAAFISHLRNASIGVLVLDEAHHLRQEWWKALISVCDAIPELTLVSLTATPPYDAQGNEWIKYEQLCGPIDEEISVPELVKAQTLCAHQDYIWAVDVTTEEKNKLKEFDDRVKLLCGGLLDNSQFIEICSAHPWLKEPEHYTVEIIKQPHVLIAVFALLKHKNILIPAPSLKMLDLKLRDVPSLSRFWWQKLIEGLLFSGSFQLNEEQEIFVKDFKKLLRASELLHKRELMLEHSRSIERSLSLSVAKIKGCLNIHQAELKKRGKSLRQVILTDYIRDEVLLNNNNNIGDVTLGSWPVFETLVEKSKIKCDIALLTGRISVVHESKLPLLQSELDSNKISTTRMENHPDFVKINGPLNIQTVLFTRLLCDGDINVLVGTRALLGEGWDAPVVNSLILASSVGSFMLTNQMRGRAIRTDKTNPDKISSIWHLVAIDRESYFGFMDYGNLVRRFSTFVGLAEKNHTIESGFERMNTRLAFYLKNYDTLKFAIFSNNRQMLSRLRALDKLSARWQQALITDKIGRVLPSVETEQLPSFKSFHLKNTFKYLFQETLLGAGSIIAGSISMLQHPNMLRFALMSFAGGMGYLFIRNAGKTAKAVRVLLRHLPVDGSLKQIGHAVLDALSKTEKLNTPVRQLNVKTAETANGTLLITLTGGTFYESSLFADTIAEVLAPIDTPRYLVIREGELLGMVRKDYHAVPTIFGIKKEFAEIFSASWNKLVGSAELIYTRNQEGREALIKAKSRAFSSAFAKELKRVDKWQ